jgi:hypothetical protein
LSWQWHIWSHRIKSQRSRQLLHRRTCRSSKRRASREPHGKEPPEAVVQSVPGTIGGGVGIAKAKKGHRQLGQSTVHAS